MIPSEPEVAIVGAGPAGAAAARALAAAGINDVVVLEREPVPGGIPRFCDHPTFGIREFGRLLTGPQYAERLVPFFAGATLACRTTVERIGTDLELDLSTPDGLQVIRPRRLLLATGIRETPRSARLVSGDRPSGVLTTGALQRILHSSYRPAFRSAVVIGSELVSFSALLTLRKLGIRPVAMIEEHLRITARKPGDLVARVLLGVPVLTSMRLLSINAVPDDPAKLASVTVAGPFGDRRDIACDCVVFTGHFVPEASLVSALSCQLVDRRTRGPAVDQNWLTRHPRIFAAGNVLRPVETAGWVFAEGRAAGNAIAADIHGRLDSAARRISIELRGPLRYVVPSALSAIANGQQGQLQVRVAQECRGSILLRINGEVCWRSRLHTFLPERRLLVPVPTGSVVHAIELSLEAAA